MACILSFCIVLLTFGNDVETAVTWSGVAGTIAGQVASRLIAGVSGGDKKPPRDKLR
jgi:hypothetical protein